MRVACLEIAGARRLVFSTDRGDSWRLIDPQRHASIRSMKAMIAGGFELQSLMVDSELLADSEQRIFQTPIGSPEKIICVGKNYEQHAREMGSEKPELPVIFNKLASCLIADGQSIVLPAISNKVDYEAELVVVVGRKGRNITRDKAFDYVFGYTIGNDVSARDWQKGRPGGQWLLGKAFDTFAPIGPWIVTADEVDDPHDLSIELKLNDQTMQSARTSELIFRIDELIAHVSQFFTLQPGDLLFTGTPAGVGAGRDPEVYLQPGDKVCISIEGIGQLTNPVIAACV